MASRRVTANFEISPIPRLRVQSLRPSSLAPDGELIAGANGAAARKDDFQ